MKYVKTILILSIVACIIAAFILNPFLGTGLVSAITIVGAIFSGRKDLPSTGGAIEQARSGLADGEGIVSDLGSREQGTQETIGRQADAIKSASDAVADGEGIVSDLGSREQGTQEAIGRQADAIKSASDAIADGESVLEEIRRNNGD